MCGGCSTWACVCLVPVSYVHVFLCQQVCLHLHVGVCRHRAEPHSAQGQREEGQGQAQVLSDLGPLCNKMISPGG